jgi:hypothetical protein
MQEQVESNNITITTIDSQIMPTKEYSSYNNEAQQILTSQQAESNDLASTSLCGSFDPILLSSSNSQVNMFDIFLF